MKPFVPRSDMLPRFLWVEFQLNDLCDAESDSGIRKVLDNLPQSLSETYDRLLGRIQGPDRTLMIERLFKWLVCARRPMSVDELREGVVFSLDDTEWKRDKIVTNFNRLVRACSNLVAVDSKTQIVELSHYTVEQYLLQNERASLHFKHEEAQIMGGEFCLAYLSFADFETRVTRFKENATTNMIALGQIAKHGLLISPDTPGQSVVKVWKNFRKSNIPLADFDMTQYLTRRPTSLETSQYSFLPYIINNWLEHTAFISDRAVHSDDRWRRIKQLFHDFVLEKGLPFAFRPWETFLPADANLAPNVLFGWGLMKHHPLLMDLSLSMQERSGLFEDDIKEGWLSFCAEANRPPPIISEHEFQNASGDSCPVDTPISWLFSKLLFSFSRGHVDTMERVAAILLQPARLEIFRYCAAVSAVYGHLPLLQFLLPLQEGPSCAWSKVRYDGYLLNALEYAIVRGLPDIAHALRTAGLEVDLVRDDETFYSSLNEAVYGMHPKNLDIIFRLHAPTLDNSRICNTFHWAASNGNTEAVEIMLRHGMDPDFDVTHEMRSSIPAIANGHVATVKVLLDYGASTACTPFGHPLVAACAQGDLAMVRLVYAHCPETLVDPRGRTFLPAFRMLRNNDQKPLLYIYPTPLHVACHHGHLEVVRFLIDRGAHAMSSSPRIGIELFRDYDKIVCKTGWPGLSFLGPLWRTSLETAKSQGHKEIFDLLLAHKSEVIPGSVSSLPCLDDLALGIWKLILFPKSNHSIFGTLDAHVHRESLNSYFLFAAGADTKGIKVEGQPSVHFALESLPDDFGASAKDPSVLREVSFDPLDPKTLF